MTARAGALGNDLFQARDTHLWPLHLTPSEFRLPSGQVSQTAADGPLLLAHNAAPQPGTASPTFDSRFNAVLPGFSLSNRAADGCSGHSTYYTDPQDLFTVLSPHFADNRDLTVFPHLGSESQTDAWHPYAFLPQQSPRNPITSPQTPTIRVTATTGHQHFTQPLDYFASLSTIYPGVRQPQASPLHLNTSFAFTHQQNIMGSNLSPDTTTIQGPPVAAKHERTSSVNSNTNMPTPVSIPCLSPLHSPTSGERAHIVASPRNHSRHDSVDSSEREADEDGSARKNYSHKRAEEPPRNQDGKMICRTR